VVHDGRARLVRPVEGDDPVEGLRTEDVQADGVPQRGGEIGAAVVGTDVTEAQVEPVVGREDRRVEVARPPAGLLLQEAAGAVGQ